MKTATTLLLVPSSFAAAYTAVARRPARSRYHCTWSTATSGTEDRTLALKQPGVAVRAAAGRKRKQIYRQPTAPDVEGVLAGPMSRVTGGLNRALMHTSGPC